jgi:protein-S-isoprenylcysteine O-methyltransferase Ste14
MRLAIFLIATALLLIFSYLIFYRVVAQDYLKKGRLGRLATILQLLVFVAFFAFPYLYMPPDWAWNWLPNGTWNRIAALVLLVMGIVLAFGTMIWFGLKRAFGLEANGMVTTGLYRYSRNPQILGGWLMVLGVFVYLPSLYGLGWVLIWTLISHWMMVNEEIHLHRLFGEEYERYSEKTPRYLV